MKTLWMTIAALTLAAVTLLCAGQEAAQPYQIKKDFLGETVEAFKQNHREERQDCIVNPAADRFPDKSTPGLYSCITLAMTQPMTYAEAKVNSRTVRFDEGRLYEIVYTFDSSWISKDMYGMYYTILLGALTDKFGKPIDIKTSDYANLTGGHVPNHIATWKNGVSTIELTELVGGLYTTMLKFSMDGLEIDARSKIVAARKPKSDM